MTPSTTLLLLGAALLTFGSCKPSSQVAGGATYSASSYHQPWQAYKTFYINPASEAGPSLTPLNQQRIVAFVTAQMVAKGLTRGDATADLVVNIVSVDTSKSGQRAGRPDNELFRIFHGGDSNPAAPEILVGSLLPPDTARAGRGGASVAAAEADSARVAATRLAGATPVPSKDSSVVSAPKPAPAYIYGALIVEVIDKKQRLLLWEGVANKPLDVPMKDPDKRISAAIGKLMQRFSAGQR